MGNQGNRIQIQHLRAFAFSFSLPKILFRTKIPPNLFVKGIRKEIAEREGAELCKNRDTAQEGKI